MDLEEMRQSWRTLETRVNRLEDENIRLMVELKRSRAGEYKRRLQRNFITLSIVGFIAPLFIIGLSNELGFSFAFVAVYSAFCWIMVVCNIYMYYRLSCIDLITMPVKIAFEESVKFGILRQRIWLGSMIMLTPALVFFIYEFWRIDISLAIAGIAGGVLGLIIGLKKDNEIRNMIRGMKQTLSDE